MTDPDMTTDDRRQMDDRHDRLSDYDRPRPSPFAPSTSDHIHSSRTSIYLPFLVAIDSASSSLLFHFLRLPGDRGFLRCVTTDLLTFPLSLADSSQNISLTSGTPPTHRHSSTPLDTLYSLKHSAASSQTGLLRSTTRSLIR